VLAVGYAVWPTADVLAQLERVVPVEGVGRIVVGYPLTLRGQAGPQARRVDLFIRKLLQRGYAVHRWDERYTTQDASRSLSKIGISQRKQRGKVDMSAAVLMLQSYLDAARHGQGNSRGE
jgi:putative Holliday junction resolvase